MKKGKIERLYSLKDAVGKIISGQEGAWLIEDWNKGLLLGEGVLSQAIKEIEQANSLYGGAFKFRVFNQAYEVFWDGQTGLFLSEQEDGPYEINTSRVLLDRDSTAFPGLVQIREKKKKKIEVNIYLQKGKEIYHRFVKFL